MSKINSTSQTSTTLIPNPDYTSYQPSWVQYSPNLAWQIANDAYTNIVYGNGVYLTFAATYPNHPIYSTDGINWNNTLSLTPAGATTLTFGNGYFVMGVTVGSSGSISFSTQGSYTNWSAASLATVTGGRQIVGYGNGTFVLVSEYTSGNGNATGLFYYTSNPATWTKGTLPATQKWGGLAFGNGKFVLSSEDGSGVILTSPDGITWTKTTPTLTYTAQQWKSAYFLGGLFILPNVNGTLTDVITYSSDGINWKQTQVNFGAGGICTSITYANGLYIFGNTNLEAYGYFDGIFLYIDSLSFNSGKANLYYNNGTIIALAGNALFGISGQTTWEAQVPYISTSQNKLIPYNNASQTYTINYMMVGGGGGGGYNCGGGGGAGAYIDNNVSYASLLPPPNNGAYYQTLTLVPGVTYTVTIGAGGAGGTTGNVPGLVGTTTTLYSQDYNVYFFASPGDGGGSNTSATVGTGSYYNYAGQLISIGSGGGGAVNGAAGQASINAGYVNSGGTAYTNGSTKTGSGGGGGATSAGTNANSTTTGSGGSGILSTLTQYYVAGGGGAGAYGLTLGTGGIGGGGSGATTGTPTAGTPNTGGGGGGGGNPTKNGAQGGSGVAVLQIPKMIFSENYTNAILSKDQQYVYLTFNTSGTYTA